MNSIKRIRFCNGKIFTGEKWLNELVIAIAADRILEVEENNPQVLAVDSTVDLQGDCLVPAFIDLQLYGGNGFLFGEHPNEASLRATVEYSIAGGAALILPTVATNSEEIMFAAIDTIKDYWRKGGKGVGGLHLEGPFLNVLKKGAHLADKIQSPTIENISRILEYGKGVVRMMTVAPELLNDEAYALFELYGVILSAGHSNANYQQANAAFKKGIRVCTHLYNAMSAFQHRSPGLPGAIFDHASVMSSIVADGHHVDPAAIRTAKKIMGERLFLITDAVAENSKGNYQHVKKDGRFCLPDGTLSGSALTMYSAVKYCIDEVGIEAGEALLMASLYPARLIGLQHEYGKIAAGFNARLIKISLSSNKVPDHFNF